MEQSTHVTWYLSKGLHTPNMDLWIMIQGRKAEANILICYCQKALTQYLLCHGKHFIILFFPLKYKLWHYRASFQNRLARVRNQIWRKVAGKILEKISTGKIIKWWYQSGLVRNAHGICSHQNQMSCDLIINMLYTVCAIVLKFFICLSFVVRPCCARIFLLLQREWGLLL